jgi:FMN phosphatase YigB (HAD superfamily)
MLIFDYDGVLLNSVDEMAVTAYNAVSGGLATSLEELPGNAAGLFKTNRFHVQPAGDAITLMRWCVDHADRPADYRLKADEYRVLRDSAVAPVVERTAHFFATRRRFVDFEVHRWRSLNSVYQPIWDTLRKKGAERVIILTNKNREATLNLCHHFDLSVKPENVYSGDHGTTKTDNLKQIQRRFGRMEHTFLDDSIANLRELDEAFNGESPMLTLLLASWGYTGPDDEDIALKFGYASVTQGEVIERLDEELPG